MLKRRIEKLEQELRGNRGKNQTFHLVEMDKGANTISIDTLKFRGTINEGETLMGNNPDELFVVLNW